MARNGSGTFSRNYDFTADRDAGSPSNVISADKMDTEFDDIASALTASIAKDGQTTPTANLPLGGFKLTGHSTSTPAARSDSVSAANLQDNGATFVAGGGTADAITATYAPAVTALVNGMELCFRASAANTTTTPTFAPNGLTAKTIVKGANTALVASDILGQHHECRVRYNSTTDKWHLLNPSIGSQDSSTIVNQSGFLVTIVVRNAQTGTTYTFLASDRGKHVTCSNASAVAVTLPQAGSAGFTNSWYSYIENIGAGLVTITPTTSTINGGSTLALQTGESYLITSDGTNYRALAMGRSSIAETDFDAANDTLSMYDNSTSSRKSVTGQVLFNSVADIATDASPATGDFVLANDVSASNVAVKQTHASVQTLFAASKSDMESASSSSKNVTPATTQNHPGVAKAHVQFVPRGTNGACTINGTAYNITGVSRTALGQYTVTFGTDFSGTVYNMAYSVIDSAGTLNLMIVMKTPAADTCAVSSISASGGGASDLGDAINLTFYGDQ